MREEELFDILIEYLRNQGYDILEQHRGHERGIDILATRNSRRLYVQLKGDASAPDVDFGTVLYQIMRYMTDGLDEYAIGISELYRDKAKQCEYPIKKLGIKLYLITESGVDLLF